MKTRLVAILICLSIFNIAYSQKGFKNNGAKVIVNSGGIINITGGTSADFINATSGSTHGRIDLDGKIKLEGDWANNATSGSVFINVDTDGEVQFKGTNVHAVSGNQTDYEKYMADNKCNIELLILKVKEMELNALTTWKDKDGNKISEKDIIYTHDIMLKELIFMLKDKIGNVLEIISLNYNPNKGMDGTIKGEKGSVNIDTILAGGYNIQKLHYRTLIYKY